MQERIHGRLASANICNDKKELRACLAARQRSGRLTWASMEFSERLAPDGLPDLLDCPAAVQSRYQPRSGSGEERPHTAGCDHDAKGLRRKEPGRHGPDAQMVLYSCLTCRMRSHRCVSPCSNRILAISSEMPLTRYDSSDLYWSSSSSMPWRASASSDRGDVIVKGCWMSSATASSVRSCWPRPLLPVRIILEGVWTLRSQPPGNWGRCLNGAGSGVRGPQVWHGKLETVVISL